MHTTLLASRVSVASACAVPMACMCIVRRIYLMTIGDMPLNALEVFFTSDGMLPSTLSFFFQKHHAVMVDLALGIGVPLIVVILSAHHVGCFPKLC